MASEFCGELYFQSKEFLSRLKRLAFKAASVTVAGIMGLMRLILALSVLVAHSGASIFGEKLLPADIAVESFYMISGFYMAMVLNEKYVRKSDVLAFWQQRFFRIYPTYYTVLLLCLIRGIRSYLHGDPFGYYERLVSHSIDPATMGVIVATNLIIIGQDLMMFLAVNPHGGLYFTPNFHAETLPAYQYLMVPQAWSLGVEISFYFVAPFILKRSVPFQVGLMLIGFLFRLAFSHFLGLEDDPWSYRFLPFELSFFLLGSLAYRVYKLRPIVYEKAVTNLGLIRWLFLLVVMNYLVIFGTSVGGRYSLFACWFFMLPVLFLATKTNSFDKVLGELSYPLYLVHSLAIAIAVTWVKHIPALFHGCFFAAFAIALAFPICRWVDYPVERFRHSLLRYRRSAGREVHPSIEVRRNASGQLG